MRKNIRRIQFITVPSGLEMGRCKMPFYSNAPIAFLWLAAHLESEGIDCHILDAYTENLGIEGILLDIARYRPDIVGLSVFTVAVYDNLFLAKKIKETFPEIIIIAGGYHVNHSWDEILESGVVDFCALREGEFTLLELIECLNQGGDPLQVKGIALKQDGQTARTINRPFRQAFDSIPILPYKKIAHNNYIPWCFNKRRKGKFFQIVTSTSTHKFRNADW